MTKPCDAQVRIGSGGSMADAGPVDSKVIGRHWRGLPTPGEVAEWLKAADCKSARASVRWFESSPLHHRQLFRPDDGDASDAKARVGVWPAAFDVPEASWIRGRRVLLAFSAIPMPRRPLDHDPRSASAEYRDFQTVILGPDHISRSTATHR